MAVSWEAFLWALTEQESGGNYQAVGPYIGGDRAYGRYQVMGSNIPSWTARYYGRSLTPAQYLASPAAQDAVVNGVLGGYFRKYGPEGAAAMWYSGQSDPSKSYGDPPVYRYVSDVISRAGRYAGGSTSSAGSGGSGFVGGVAQVGQLDMDLLAQQYGLSSAMINANVELKRIFKQAVAEDWGASQQGQARFLAAVRNTRWWATQSDTQRKYVTLRYTDPASWQQKNNQSAYALNQMAVAVGLPNQIDPHNRQTQLLQTAVYYQQALGWSDAQLKNWLGARVTVDKNQMMSGEAGQTLDKLHQLAYVNGMSYSGWYADEVRAILGGKDTMEAAEANIRAQAAAKYSAFAPQIKAGQNVIDLAAPYIKSVSNILERPEGDVDLFDPHVSKAMTYSKDGQAYSLWQFETDLRSDPLWKKTKNAQDSLMQTGHQVLQQMGMVF